MNLDRNIILGVSPGTRVTGMVIVNERELIDWRILRSNGAWSETRLRKIRLVIEQAIAHYGITAISLKLTKASKLSLGLNQLVLAIIAIAQEKSIQLYTYTFDDLKEEYEVDNREALITYFVHFHPDFAKPLRKVRGKRNPYNLKLFEALGCAIHSRNVPPEIEE